MVILNFFFVKMRSVLLLKCLISLLRCKISADLILFKSMKDALYMKWYANDAASLILYDGRDIRIILFIAQTTKAIDLNTHPAIKNTSTLKWSREWGPIDTQSAELSVRSGCCSPPAHWARFHALRRKNMAGNPTNAPH